MKTLILCVDRDDDIGKKGGVASPIIGRRRNLDAAMALGLADPEDSDTNALLAAVKLYDDELKRGARAEQIEVATVTGHPKLGLEADRKLARELEQVLAQVHPDEVILVSDGAEDEQVLPLLNSRAKVSHVHRSIVKQAPRLEGFYYVITRLLDDEKQAKRFVLPFAVLLLGWGTAYLLQALGGFQKYPFPQSLTEAAVPLAWSITLGIIGFWLLMHVMKWEERVSRFFSDIGRAVRAGKLGLVANVVMAALLLAGFFISLRLTRDHAVPAGAVVVYPTVLKACVFLQEFLPYLVSAFLVRTAGALFDGWARKRRASVGHWTAAFTLIAFGFMGSVMLDAAIQRLQGADVLHILTQVSSIVQFVGGFAVLLAGIVISRYARASSSPQA